MSASAEGGGGAAAGEERRGMRLVVKAWSEEGRIGHFTKEVFIQFLQQHGTEITALDVPSVSESGDGFNAQVADAIVTHCPNLKKFGIDRNSQELPAVPVATFFCRLTPGLEKLEQFSLGFYHFYKSFLLAVREGSSAGHPQLLMDDFMVETQVSFFRKLLAVSHHFWLNLQKIVIQYESGEIKKSICLHERWNWVNLHKAERTVVAQYVLAGDDFQTLLQEYPLRMLNIVGLDEELGRIQDLMLNHREAIRDSGVQVFWNGSQRLHARPAPPPPPLLLPQEDDDVVDAAAGCDGVEMQPMGASRGDPRVLANGIGGGGAAGVNPPASPTAL